MKQTLLLFLALLCVGSAVAQSAFEEIKKDPGKSGGVYYAYPVPTVKQTPAPKGYKAFYISHYGRHGSRYLLNDRDYSGVLGMLRKANEDNALTAKGKDVLDRMEKIWQEAEFHGDELAPLGKRQHRGIAERMFENYPQLFKGPNAKVTAKSTTSMRVALSMLAFCERLKELNPQLDLQWETTNANMKFLNSHTRRYDQLKRNYMGGWQKVHNDFCARGINADRFASQLIADTAYFRKANLNKGRLMSGLFDVASDLQDMETDISLYDIFTTEELYENWRNSNSWFYNCDANSPHNEGTAMESTCPLLQNFIDEAKKAIEGKGETATLRFGHDGNIIPLAAILRLKGCDAQESDMNNLQTSWQNYYVSPMGANIQLVFYRKGNTDDIVVKFMLNEIETSIPVNTDLYPFYHWSDVLPYLENQIKQHQAK